MTDIKLISNGIIVTMNKQRKVINRGSIVIKDNKIARVGSTAKLSKQYRNAEVIEARGKMVIPGLINAHTHSVQNLFRGLGDDKSLQDWLSTVIYPLGEIITPDDVYVGAKISYLEMLKSGITTVIDQHKDNRSLEATRQVVKAAKEIGIRAYIARGMRVRTDRCAAWDVPLSSTKWTLKEEIKMMEQLIKEINKPGSIVKVLPGPAAMFCATKELLEQAKELAKTYGLPFHFHCAETQGSVKACFEDNGRREVEFLNDSNALDSLTHLVHTIWVTDHEIDLIAASGANVMYCPVSNMLLGSGTAPITRMMKKGINVALGADGSTSNNNQDLFGCMKTAALLQKIANNDPKAITAQQVFEMATLNGAKALGASKWLGSIEPGKVADIVILDINQPNTIPIFNCYSNLVYSTTPKNVETVIVNGKEVLKNGKVKTVNESKTLQQAAKVAEMLGSKIKKKPLSNFF